jgi:heterodisulfide reductase subunit A
VEYARGLPLVSHVEDNLYSCSDAGLSAIKDSIRDHDLNRVVVASCTPRTHEELFRRACEEAGVNRYLFEFVNLREHCSWIHFNQPDEATVKAMELLRLGVAKAALLEPLEMAQASVIPACLVIGGGAAGLAAAGSLARQGFEVHLVERTEQLGGNASSLWKLLPGDRSAADLVRLIIQDVKKSKNVKTYLESAVEDISGFIGAFTVHLATNKGHTDIQVGTVILATGARELEPLGLYSLGRLEGVKTQLQLEQILSSGKKRFGDVVFINCAGARVPERTYCGRLCCAVALKNARFIREIDPNSRVTILQRDIMAFGTEFEKEYHRAREAGVRFIRYIPERLPNILGSKKVDGVHVYHQLAGEEMDIKAQTVVLTTPLVPHTGAERLSRMLKVPLDSDGFFLEAHVKLRPVEFATDGIFIAGAARFPVNIQEAVLQGTAAAAKAGVPMSSGQVSVEATIARSDPHICSGCGNCEVVCPFAAIQIEPDRRGRPVSVVNGIMCKGCGACVAVCPNGAIQQQGFTDLQLFSMVESLVFDTDTPGSGEVT